MRNNPLLFTGASGKSGATVGAGNVEKVREASGSPYMVPEKPCERHLDTCYKYRVSGPLKWEVWGWGPAMVF